MRRARRRTRRGRTRPGRRPSRPGPTSFTGMPSVGLDGEDDAALGRAVELGEHHAGDVDGLGELLGLGQAVLAGGGVEHQQHLGDVARVAVGHPPHLAQLLHQVGLGVEPAGGVGQHEVVPAGRRPLRRRRRSPTTGRRPRCPARSRRRCARPTSSSCSAAAARNVSPAAITTCGPASRCWRATLPMVVVLPTPLTPTNSHTLGGARRRGAVERSPRRRCASSALSSSFSRSSSSSGSVIASASAAARRSVEDPLRWRPTPTSARISASSSSSQVSSSTLRDRMAPR